ncbi:MAG: TRAP transporter large permease [Planctomycetota bacterium]|jgi:tripartite ATP-independent transporter DctM subunit|nr:TRAP transporter large permease [Planctomycetota bacterium]
MIVLMLIVLFGTLLLGMPIAFSLTGTAIVLLVAEGVGMIPLTAIPQNIVAGVDSFTMLAVPLFILAGKIMNAGQITDRIFNLAELFVGRIRGGLAHVNVLASLIFAGMSGSAVADASGLGEIEIKAMNSRGYDPEFSAAITAASSVIGPIFPPSIPMIIYGGLAGVSIGRLFVGGAVPGVLMAIVLMLACYIVAVRRNYPREGKPSREEAVRRLKEGILPALSPAIVLGAIVTGITTPTEAALIAVIYSALLAGISKTLRLRDIPGILVDVGVESGVLLFIVGGVSLFSWTITYHFIPQDLITMLMNFSPEYVILITIVILFIIGLFMNPTPGLIMSMPFLLPLAEKAGLDLVQFGVLSVLVLSVGLLTPPVGLCLYIVARVGNVPVEKVLRELVLFIIVLMVICFICAYVPQTVVFLPNLLFGK